MRSLRITLLPKTRLGQSAALLSLAFVILIALKMGPGFPLGSLVIVGLGLVGFVLGVTSFVRKDRSVGGIFSIVVGAAILFVIGAVFISSAGLFKDFPVKDALTQAEAGESGGETNLGVVSESNGLIYYLLEDTLYQRRLDWTGRTKIAELRANSIYVEEDRILYVSSEDNKLYHMALDGTGKTVLTNDLVTDFVVAGDLVVFSAKPSSGGTGQSGKDPTQPGVMAAVRIGQPGITQLAELGTESRPPKIAGEWVYFSDGANLVKIRPDGTERTLVAQGAGIEYISGDWAYFCTRIDEGKGMEKVTVSRLRLDGTERTEIITLSGVYSYAFDADWFYYTPGPGLSRVRLDGTNTQKLNNVSIWSLLGVSGDWFYLADYGGPMFRVKLDGSVGTRLN
jgi:hypothetical protein